MKTSSDDSKKAATRHPAAADPLSRNSDQVRNDEARNDQTQNNQIFKTQLRQNLSQRRRELDSTTRRCLESQINGHIMRWVSGRPEHHIAAYWPVRGEADIRPALGQLSASGRQIYLPRVDEQRQGEMHFVPWDPNTPTTQLNRYGIPEPPDHNARRAAELDVILAPLLAFCPRGGRLGAGAGYYDRACAAIDRDHTWFIGIAYGFQMVEGLPQEPWDIPLDGIFTEQGLQACNTRLQTTLALPANDQEHNEWPIG